MLELESAPTKQEIDELSQDSYLAFYMLLGTWERLGILVYRREIDITMVEDAFSGPILISWGKLENYVLEVRSAWKRDGAFEWFQWLAERVQEREHKLKPPPAYVAFKNWKP